MRGIIEQRHGASRPYKPDTGASAAEEAGTRRGLGEGRIVLAPRLDGWVEVSVDHADRLVERPIMGRDGRQIDVWDNAGLSRWMRDGRPMSARFGLLDRLGAIVRR